MKPRWADMTDDDPIEDTVVTKHGVKVKKPPPPSPDKTKSTIEVKKDDVRGVL
jgi:hypothetical protein